MHPIPVTKNTHHGRQGGTCKGKSLTQSNVVGVKSVSNQSRKTSGTGSFRSVRCQIGEWSKVSGLILLNVVK